MSILIMGCNGSMGKRYQAILKHLNQPFVGVDIHHTESEIMRWIGSVDSAIVATPTDTHFEILKKLIPFQKPILCEKPVTKSLKELEILLNSVRKCRTPFRMVFQYEMLIEPGSCGKSYYNYFRHGSDGIVWDCMQIIALSNGDPILKESSPIWRCKINGTRLKLSQMDRAYMRYIQKWLKSPFQDLDQILDYHVKTHLYESYKGEWS